MTLQDHVLEVSPCYICMSEQCELWAEEAGYTALKCLRCGLIYVSPRPRLDAIDDGARTGMHQTDRDPLSTIGRYSRIKEHEYRSVLSRLFRDTMTNGPVRWLDVGAGHGELLTVLGHLLPTGSTAKGVEPNERKATAARARRLDVVEDMEAANDSYDVVSLMNVYSHLPDPKHFLGALRLQLRPSGYLLVQTGNAAELVSRHDYPDLLYLPDHLSFTGEPQLRKVLLDIGFIVEEVERRRFDGLLNTAASLGRRMLGHRARITLPYRSDFRSLFVRARRER